jgi:predicted AlkP superfamily phosphohydrolase/phosphomutase
MYPHEIDGDYQDVSHNPTVFIGLDGAEPTCIEGWLGEGLLPNLARLAQTGVVSRVATLPGLGDGALWPTLLTGVTPARHGRYFRRQLKLGTYRRHLFEVDTDLSYHSFWQPISDAGRRVAVLDLPYAPCTSVNGRLLVDWLIHDRYGATRSYPAGYAAEVLHEYGDDPTGGNSDKLRGEGMPLEELCRRILLRVEMKTRLVVANLASDDWDLVATAFTEPHDTGHSAWHMHDPGHPKHDAAWVAKHGDPILDLYVAVDDAIGKIVSAAPRQANILVFAGLGMENDYTANRVLDRILSRLDSGRDPSPSPLSRWRKRSGTRSLWQRVIRRVDGVFQRKSLARRRYFALEHNENSGAIRINLRGREPHGLVPVSDYDKTCDELERQLLDIVNPDTGEPLVSDVVRVRRTYEGERLDMLPDLMVVWNRIGPFTSAESSTIGRIDGIRSWGRTGDHSPNAVLYASGPNVTWGSVEARIVDIAPTIAALQGVVMPSTDGVSLTTTNANR